MANITISKGIRLTSVVVFFVALFFLLFPQTAAFEALVLASSNDHHVESSTLDKAGWVMRMLGLLLFLTSLITYIFSNRIGQMLLLLRDQFNVFKQDLRNFIRSALVEQTLLYKLCFTLIFIAGAMLRLAYINQPMHSDESYTFVQYISQGPLNIISVYTAPNNHVFSNLLTWLCVTLFGAEHWVIRIPTFLAGLLVLPLTYGLAFKISKQSALWAMAFTAVSVELISYACVARGYSIITALFVTILLLGLYLLQKPHLFTVILFSVLSMLGFWTIPTMLFPFGIVLVFLCLMAMREGVAKIDFEIIKCVFQIGVLTTLLTLVLYIPVIGASGLDAMLKNRFVTPLPFDRLLSTALGFFVELMGQWQDEWGLLGQGVFLLLVIGALLYKKSGPTLRCVWLSSLLVFIVLTVVQRRVAPVRGWLFFVPIYLSTAAMGIRFVLHKLGSPRIANSPLPAAFVCLVLMGSILKQGTVAERIVPIGMDSAEEMLLDLLPLLEPSDKIVAHIPSHTPLEFYFLEYNVSFSHLWTAAEDITEENLADAGAIYIVVNRPFLTLEGYVEKSAIPSVEHCERVFEYANSEVWKFESN